MPRTSAKPAAAPATRLTGLACIRARWHKTVCWACIAVWFLFDVARLRSIARARWVRDYRRAERQVRQAPTP